MFNNFVYSSSLMSMCLSAGVFTIINFWTLTEDIFITCVSHYKLHVLKFVIYIIVWFKMTAIELRCNGIFLRLITAYHLKVCLKRQWRNEYLNSKKFTWHARGVDAHNRQNIVVFAILLKFRPILIDAQQSGNKSMESFFSKCSVQSKMRS